MLPERAHMVHNDGEEVLKLILQRHLILAVSC